ncbi:MAG TPA: hypothetical protein P5096_02520 [Patescibacteria group bacterium]|nr:hypothetical protein [Patescibacteria group bacterium]
MNINSDTKVDILIKIYKKDRKEFQKILMKFINYPPGILECAITNRMIHNQTKSALMFKLEVDLVALPYFLKEVKPFLNDGMEDLIFYRTTKKVGTALGPATLDHPAEVATASHGWIMLIGVKEIESISDIEYLLEKSVEEIRNIFGKKILGFLRVCKN